MFFTAKTQRNESALVPRVRRVVNHGGCHRGHRGHRDHSRKVSFNEIGSRPLNDHWLLVPRSPGVIVNCFSPYPRSPLREFTPCAPGRSSPFDSLLIAHRLIVFASNHIHGAEAVTGPVLWCRFTGGDHVPQAAAQGKADFLSPAERPEIMASPSADPREPL